MAKFHIGKNGKVSRCSARKGNCPYGSDEEHFASREEGVKVLEKQFEEKYDITNSTSRLSVHKQLSDKFDSVNDEKKQKLEDAKKDRDLAKSSYESARNEAVREAFHQAFIEAQKNVRRLTPFKEQIERERYQNRQLTRKALADFTKLQRERDKAKADKEREEVKANERKKSSRTFEEPHTYATEGYMGAPGFEGSNYLRLKKEGGFKAHDNKYIASEIRSDIKAALRDGYLPKEINGNKLTYRVNNSGYNSVNATIVIDGDDYDSRTAVISEPYGNGFRLQRMHKDQEKLGEAVSKLDTIVQSYNYDESNSMVDYFNSNFYSDTKFELKNAGFNNCGKAEKKAIKAVVDDYIDKGSSSLSSNSSSEEVDAAISRAMSSNPKVARAVREWANAEAAYVTNSEIDKEAFEMQHNINGSNDKHDAKYLKSVEASKYINDKISRGKEEHQARILHNDKTTSFSDIKLAGSSKPDEVYGSDESIRNSLRRSIVASIIRRA